MTRITLVCRYHNEAVTAYVDVVPRVGEVIEGRISNHHFKGGEVVLVAHTRVVGQDDREPTILHPMVHVTE